MLRLVIITILAIAINPLFAQEHVHNGRCGITPEDAQVITERLLENKAALASGLITERGTVYIPVKFHLIGRADRSGRISPSRVLDQLCALNEDFEPVGFQFYLKDGMNEIFNNTVFDNHSATQNTIMEFQKDNNAINVFIPDNANTGNSSGQGQTLGYYSPFKDWLVLKKGEVGAGKSTAPHEFGHFFGLPHPFNGWDFETWDEATHGNPVTRLVAPDGTTPVELANGSNCNTSGDYICDTPANYGFGFGWANCSFTAQVRDRNGDLLEPEERLFMSYFLSCPRDEYFFSEDQISLMNADYQTPRRARIRTGHTPSLAAIDETPQLIAPINSTILDNYNAVNISWEPVSGAQAYILQIARLPTFSAALVVYDEIVYGTSKQIETLQANTNYFWRIRPFSSYRACADFSAAGAFTTGGLVSANDQSLVELFQVSPNPLSSGNELRLDLTAKQSFEAQIVLYNAAGQEVQQMGSFRIAQGANTFQLPTANLAPGLYFLALSSEQGRQFQRLVIGR